MHRREPLERAIRRIWRAIFGQRVRGRVVNHTSRPLWVLETDSGRAIAHRLEPGQASPTAIDADAFRSVDGTPIDGEPSWIKIYDFVTAVVRETPTRELVASGWLRRPVEEREFGPILYEAGPWPGCTRPR